MGPTIQTTIGALVSAERALHKLAALKLEPQARYHVAKLLKLVGEETRDHFYVHQQAAFKELGTARAATHEELTQGRAPQVLSVPIEKHAELSAAITPFLDVGVTIPWGPVTAAMIEPVPEFTAIDMLALGPLFALDEPTKRDETQAV